MSQLGALRSVMGALLGDDCETVRQWIRHLQLVKSRKDKWPEGALKKLDDLMKEPKNVWRKLGLEGEERPESNEGDKFRGAPPPAHWNGFDALGDQRLQRFAVRTLLLEAMRVHKRDIERARPKEPTLATEVAR